MMRVIINSIPKSGTHLVERALGLLGVSREPPLFLSSATVGLYPANGDETVPVGVGMPVRISAARLREALVDLLPGQVVTAHIPHSHEMDRLLRDLQFRMILIVRDPRDVAVSLAHHIARETSHRLHARFAELSPEERIEHAITGFTGSDGEQLEDVGRRFCAVLPWLTSDLSVLIRFEDLVGPQGGGSEERQHSALINICDHLHVSPDLAKVQRELFGTGATFRKGIVGQWREQFTEAHHQAFDRVGGSLLAELGYR